MEALHLLLGTICLLEPTSFCLGGPSPIGGEGRIRGSDVVPRETPQY